MDLFVAVVGVGLAIGLHTISGSRLQIDCGSQQSGARAYERGLRAICPNAFVLSHFHTDHYNGLFHASRRDGFEIRQVFLPRLPVFPEARRFLECMFAMARRALGHTTGSVEADVLNVIAALTRHDFSYQFLSAGESVDAAGAHIEVLWPPRILKDEEVRGTVRKAIDDFNRAASEDEELKRLRDQIGEAGTVEPYLTENESPREMHGRNENERRWVADHPDNLPRELPEVVKRANASLRTAANHLSLAFHEDNRLLFLGDLEAYEIQQVVAALIQKRRVRFFATITPHHGTHWHSALSDLRTSFAISSVGERGIGKFCTDYKSIAGQCLVTHLNGDITLPGPLSWNYSRHPGRWMYSWPPPWI